MNGHQKTSKPPVRASSRFDIFEPSAPSSGQKSKTPLSRKCLAAAAVVTFLSTAVCLHVQQWLGVPLYLLSKKWYSNWQAIVKQSTALLLLALNQLRAPTVVRISGDASVVEMIRGKNRPRLLFPDRLVLIANHQIYTDWIFFWWIAYAAGQHGRLFVILKDSLGRIPIIGSGMKFFSWIFLSRRWDTDRDNFEGGIRHLADVRPSDAMWLLLFPEGTNMSRNARAASQKWSSKSGVADLKHVLLPRSRGLQCCLQGLSSTVDWVYDCTIAYDGIQPGEYGQEVHSLKKLYIEGRKAPAVHMYWRRYPIEKIPYDDLEELDRWILDRWTEKDALLEYFQQNGRFPADDGFVVANVGIQNWIETIQILGAFAAVAIVWWTAATLYGCVDNAVRAAR